MSVLVIIILSIFVLTSIYIISNLLRKTEQVEEAYIQASNTNEVLYLALKELTTKLQEIDDKGVFESDDEVGATFKQIYETVKSVDEVFITTNEK